MLSHLPKRNVYNHTRGEYIDHMIHDTLFYIPATKFDTIFLFDWGDRSRSKYYRLVTTYSVTVFGLKLKKKYRYNSK